MQWFMSIPLSSKIGIKSSTKGVAKGNESSAAWLQRMRGNLVHVLM